jgi:hypothetical protein
VPLVKNVIAPHSSFFFLFVVAARPSPPPSSLNTPPTFTLTTMFSCLVPRPGSPDATPSKLGALSPGSISVRAVVPTNMNRALEPRQPPGPHAAQHARAFARALVENAEYR